MAPATITAQPVAELPTLLADLRATRARAVSALEELRRAQRESEARMAERPGGGGGATYRRVAGTTSLERAAHAAERIIAAADRQLAGLAGQAEISSGAAAQPRGEDWARAPRSR